MKVVKEILYEKFSEETDPIHAMGIGEIPVKDIMQRILVIDDKHKKKIAYINAKMTEHFEFVMKARNITKQHIRYLKKILEEAGYLDFFRFSKRINHSIFFGVKDQYKKMIKNDSYISRELNEKFDEISDPVRDMGIGMEQEVKKFKKFIMIDRGGSPQSALDFGFDKKLLAWAAYYNRFDIAEYALKIGYDIDYDHGIALHYAACAEPTNIKMGVWLINHGANLKLAMMPAALKESNRETREGLWKIKNAHKDS